MCFRMYGPGIGHRLYGIRKRRDTLYEGNLVICDQEQQYSRNLLQMFARNREADIQMYLFHTIEEVEKFAEQKPVHTLLIGK